MKFCQLGLRAPIIILTAYAVVILLCATVYTIFSCEFEQEVSFWDGLYLSVVTVTTLGYGDITPGGEITKTVASIESLLGVLLMGLLLFFITNQIVDYQERKTISSAREILKIQYRTFRKDTIHSLLIISQLNETVSSSLEKELEDVGALRKYFGTHEILEKVEEQLSSDDYHCKEINYRLERLQRHIETYILVARIQEQSVLGQLVRYVDTLEDLRRQDLGDYDGQRRFISGLRSILMQWDVSSGNHGRDLLLAAIE